SRAWSRPESAHSVRVPEDCASCDLRHHPSFINVVLNQFVCQGAVGARATRRGVIDHCRDTVARGLAETYVTRNYRLKDLFGKVLPNLVHHLVREAISSIKHR